MSTNVDKKSLKCLFKAIKTCKATLRKSQKYSTTKCFNYYITYFKSLFDRLFCYILFSESLYLMNQKDFKLTLE